MGIFLFFVKNLAKLGCFQVHIGSSSSDFYFQKEDVPQGSILSIIFDSLKINGILKQLSCIVHGNLYIADMNIFCQEKDMHCIWLLNGLLTWTNKKGLVYPIEKTHCLHFSCTCSLHPDLEVFRNQWQISVSDMAQYLCILIFNVLIPLFAAFT